MKRILCALAATALVACDHAEQPSQSNTATSTPEVNTPMASLANDIIPWKMASTGHAAARMVSTSARLNGPWPNGKVPYYFDASVNAASKLAIREAMATWESSTGGLIDFIEMASGSNNRWVKIYMNPSSSPMIDGALAMASLGYPSDAVTSPSQPVVALPSEPWSRLEIDADGKLYINYLGYTEDDFRKAATHELGHVLGLKHEQTHPRYKEFVYAQQTTGAQGCPVDPFQAEGAYDASAQEVQQASTSSPDLRSVMNYASIPCGTSGNVHFYEKSTGTWLGTLRTATPSEGDVWTVKQLYTPTFSAHKWDATKPIVVRVTVDPSLGLNSSYFSNVVREAFYRWTSVLDPQQTALSFKFYNPYEAPTGNALSINVRPATAGENGFTLSCPATSGVTNNCTVTLPAQKASDGTLLLTKPIYRTNIFQALIGQALGVSPLIPQSAAYKLNNWENTPLFPTEMDVKAIQSIYNPLTSNFLPLITVTALGSVDSRTPYQRQYTSWTEVAAIPAKEVWTEFSAVVVGRVPVSGSVFGSLVAPLRRSAYSSMSSTVNGIWSALNVNEPFGTGIPSTCPEAAKTEANQLASTSTSMFRAPGVFQTPQSFTKYSLFELWNGTTGHWETRTVSSSFETIITNPYPCSKRIGYVATPM